MGGDKVKKKCCGKYKKKGTHCNGCPLSGKGGKCTSDKDYCKDCDIPKKKKKAKKDGRKKAKKNGKAKEKKDKKKKR